MKELFREEYSQAEEKLNSKGYCVDCMIYSSDEFEVSNEDKVLIDHLSLAQLVQLSEMLQPKRSAMERPHKMASRTENTQKGGFEYDTKTV